MSIFLTALLFGIVLIFPVSAYAYLDAGTGSMILQAVLAAIAGIALVLKIFWRRIKRLVTGPSDADNQDLLAADEAEDEPANQAGTGTGD